MQHPVFVKLLLFCDFLTRQPYHFCINFLNKIQIPNSAHKLSNFCIILMSDVGDSRNKALLEGKLLFANKEYQLASERIEKFLFSKEFCDSDVENAQVLFL